MLNWYENVDTLNPLAVSSRIRLARNIKGVPFPKRMNNTQKEETLESFKKLLDGVKLGNVGTLKYINMETVPEEELFETDSAMVARLPLPSKMGRCSIKDALSPVPRFVGHSVR